MSIATQYPEIIDSRDVETEIDELEDREATWAVGVSQPGCLHDSQTLFTCWDDAYEHMRHEALAYAEMRNAKSLEQLEERFTTMSENKDYIIQVGSTVFELYIPAECMDTDGEELDTLDTLREFRDDALQAMTWAEWTSGITLYRSDCMADYAKEFAQSVEGLRDDSFIWDYIDFNKMGDDLADGMGCADLGRLHIYHFTMT